MRTPFVPTKLPIRMPELDWKSPKMVCSRCTRKCETHSWILPLSLHTDAALSPSCVAGTIKGIVGGLLGREIGMLEDLFIYPSSFGGNGIAAQISVGAGMSTVFCTGEKACTIALYDDGARTQVHTQVQVSEAFNMAKLWNLPTFIGENNKYEMGTTNATLPIPSILLVVTKFLVLRSALFRIFSSPQSEVWPLKNSRYILSTSIERPRRDLIRLLQKLRNLLSPVTVIYYQGTYNEGS